MPIYSYTCSECNKDFEVLAKPGDNRSECTSCGSKKIKRVYSSFDFSLKKNSAPVCQSGSCPGGTCGI